MNIPALILSILLLPALSFAKTPVFDCLPGTDYSSKESASLLQRVQKEYGNIKNFSGNFYQESYLAALEASETSSGKLWYSKPGKMKWHYKEPDEQIFTVKDNALWLYQIGENQVLIDDFQTAFISDLPVSFIMGVGNLSKDFTLLKVCGNEEGAVLELQPRSKGGDISKKDATLKNFKLLVSLSSYFPIGAEVFDVSGNRTAILFNQMGLGLGIDAKEFETSFPKGTDINDRRRAAIATTQGGIR